MKNRVESLRNETGGAVQDSDEDTHNSNISMPPIINDSYQQKEHAMLNFINSSSQNGLVNLYSFSTQSINCVYMKQACILIVAYAVVEAPPPPPQDAEPPMEADANTNIFVKGLPAPWVWHSYDEAQKNQPGDSVDVHSSKPAMQQERRARLV
jgi:hypothetical protein